MGSRGGTDGIYLAQGASSFDPLTFTSEQVGADE